MDSVIYDEREVRKWVRDSSRDNAMWIEPNNGSTVGLPDCFFLYGGLSAVSWHELKVGEMKMGGVYYTVRPQQRNKIRTFLKNNHRICLIVGIKKTKEIICFLPTPDACFGKIESLELALSQGWAKRLTDPQYLVEAFGKPYGIMSLACEMSELCDTWTRSWGVPGLISWAPGGGIDR